ncbi:MAG TPA: hypothetical protein VKF81_17775 [Blastocatellia bacterium]|nr:hypothetical protein [Blastocatellia bacterium]
MKILSLPEAEASGDIDIKMMATRASRYRVFGSSERIPDAELAVVDLRDGNEPDDFAERYEVLDRHFARAIVLVRRLG